MYLAPQIRSYKHENMHLQLHVIDREARPKCRINPHIAIPQDQIHSFNIADNIIAMTH